MVGFYLACSQQQFKVPLGICGSLLVRLLAPVSDRPRTSQQQHTTLPVAAEESGARTPFSSLKVPDRDVTSVGKFMILP